MLDKGTVVIGGITGDDIEQAVELVKAMQENLEPTVLASDHIDANVSLRWLRLYRAMRR